MAPGGISRSHGRRGPLFHKPPLLVIGETTHASAAGGLKTIKEPVSIGSRLMACPLAATATAHQMLRRRTNGGPEGLPTVCSIRAPKISHALNAQDPVHARASLPEMSSVWLCRRCTPYERVHLLSTLLALQYISILLTLFFLFCSVHLLKTVCWCQILLAMETK